MKSIMQDQNGSIIVDKNARFTKLSEGLVRMEYDSRGRFEDRKSFFAISRQAALPFERVDEQTGSVILRTTKMEVRYRADGNGFTAKNLSVRLVETGQLLWRPNSVDCDNLGSVHMAMDLVNRQTIPSGVHPAGDDLHPNDTRASLPKKGRYCGTRGSMQIEELLASCPLEKMPAKGQALFRERMKYPPGLLSRNGYFLLNDSKTSVMDDNGWFTKRNCGKETRDLYLFAYGNDYKAALKDYIALTGAPPLLPRYCLGLWYSRHPTFDEKKLRSTIRDFSHYGLPLDVVVLDLAWHGKGWHGFEWDRAHMPNPEGFIRHLKRNHMHITLNVHPGAVPASEDCCRKFVKKLGLDWKKITLDREGKLHGKFFEFDFGKMTTAQAYAETLLRPNYNMGADFYWVDGAVSTGKLLNHNPHRGTNHIYLEDMKKNILDRRPLVLSRSCGIGAQREGINFTGDAYSQWEVLRTQVEWTLRGGHNAQAFISHDIGGFKHEMTDLSDPELYARWVQFGALSPILRLHSSLGGERRPWKYGPKVLDSAKKALELRMSLLPYLYSLNHEAHASGVPLCRSNALEMPEWKEGYSIWDSYFLGDRIYAAPVVCPQRMRKVILPPGEWYSFLSECVFKSDGKKETLHPALLSHPPLHFYKVPSIIVKQPFAERAELIPEALILAIYVKSGNCASSFTLYEDDGLSRDYKSGMFALTEYHMKKQQNEVTISIGAASGRFRGMPQKRDYIIKVFGMQAVAALTDDGQKSFLQEDGSFLFRGLSVNRSNHITIRSVK